MLEVCITLDQSKVKNKVTVLLPSRKENAGNENLISSRKKYFLLIQAKKMLVPWYIFYKQEI